MNVAIIPARGGSKRIPKKNIEDFCGNPMIFYSIRAALDSGAFDRVIVSTDSEAIAEVARECGAETPFMRPAELSDDYVGTDAVTAHAMEWLADNGEHPLYGCSIYPTAPLLTAQNIQQGLKLLEEGHDAAMTVASFSYPIRRGLRIQEDGSVGMIWPEHLATRSQDLEDAYHDAGQIYWFRTDKYLATASYFELRPAPIVLPSHQVVDIDTWDDFRFAERLYRINQEMLAESESPSVTTLNKVSSNE